jgi:hypothetical protein
MQTLSVSPFSFEIQGYSEMDKSADINTLQGKKKNLFNSIIHHVSENRNLTRLAQGVVLFRWPAPRW